MPSLQELGTVPDEEIPSDPVEELPEPSGGFLGAADFQRDWHTFVLPDADGFDFDVSDKDFNNNPVLRVRLGSYRDKQTLGKHLKVEGKISGLYGCEINTYSRPVFGKTSHNVDLLLQALGESEIPKKPLEKAQLLVKHAGEKFRARMKLSAKFSADRHGVNQRYESWVTEHNKKHNLPPETVFKGKTKPDGSPGNDYYPIMLDKGKYPAELEIAVNGHTVSTRVWPDFDQFGKA